MRHQAVMGVVAVACVAVVSAPMIVARGGGHHRGGRPAERHQYLAGVDFTQDPAVAAAEAAVGRLMLARLDSGALLLPKAPPEPSDDGVYSPFIGLVPPGFGLGGGGLQQPTAPQQASPQEPPWTPMQDAHARSRGLMAAVGAETPEPPPELPPPPVLTPEPTVVPDPPVPPVIVVVEIPPVEPPPPGPPPEIRPVPVVLTQNATPPVTVAAVPEPGTWAMLVLGFGALGAAIRRRRRERPVPEGSC